MKDNKKEIKKGITLHCIKANNFKTDMITVFLTTKLTREDVTKNAIIPMVLRKGSSKLETEENLNKHLEEMYGAGFDCGIDKTGDNQVLKFYLESIDNKYLPSEEEILEECIQTLIDIVFDPKLQNGVFEKQYVDTAKEKLKIILEGKKDNKMQYANLRCQEEMYKDTPFGIYKYGYIEDIDKIDEINLYEQYKRIIDNCKIDIFVTGNIEEDKIIELFLKNEKLKKLNEREGEYNRKSKKLEKREEREIIENLDVTQGNLVLGLSVSEIDKKESYSAVIYNAIFGGTATSKMFKIVREEHSLAYTASSNYLRHKNSLFVRCGIEIENYEKTLNLIREQIADMEKGEFTKEDIENAKTSVISTIKMIPDEQDTIIAYFLGQELSENKMSLDEYEENVNKVTKEDIQEFAKKVSIDTIYFLRN